MNYYVDKTRFIPQLEDEGRFVIFLRPRRYGKSLTIAMLEYYYGRQYADRFEDIFGHLFIGQYPTEKCNMLAKLGGMVSYFISATEPDLNHGYADLYLEPWTEKTTHAYIIELKYLNSGATDAEVAQKRLEAIKQANSYAADKHLQQRADAKGWALHKFVIVFSGWKLQLVEEV